MTNLRGILQRCRVSGFTLDYTKHILSAAFADGDKEPKFIKPNDCAWPPVSARSVTNPSYASSLHPVSEPLGLRLHHSRSFAEEVEEGMKRFSILSSRSIVSHTDGLLEEQRRRDQSNDALTDDTQQYSSTRESMFSNFTSQNEFESPPDASTPRLQQGEIMCTRTFEVSEGTRTPSPERCSTPKSPETLNKLNERDPAFIRTLNAIKTQSQIEANEQDPAFIRSVEGLRSNPQTETPPILGEDRPRSFMPSTTTTIQSPAERSALSMSARTNETTGIIRRRYLSFVGRLRGRADT
jgi:hypothetical protein